MARTGIRAHDPNSGPDIVVERLRRHMGLRRTSFRRRHCRQSTTFEKYPATGSQLASTEADSRLPASEVSPSTFASAPDFATARRRRGIRQVSPRIYRGARDSNKWCRPEPCILIMRSAGRQRLRCEKLRRALREKCALHNIAGEIWFLLRQPAHHNLSG